MSHSRKTLRALAEDKVVQAAFPPFLMEVYTALKADEWARFCGYVTDWEKSYYAQALP